MNKTLIVEKIEKQAALKIFNLTQSAFDQLTKDDFLKLWKSLVKNSHPDKGGSTEKTQLINAAKDILLPLKNRSKSSKQYDPTWWAESDKKYKAVGLHIKNDLKNSINYGEYTKHFKEVFNQPFKYKIRDEYPLESTSEKSSIYNAWVTIEFYTTDRNIVLELHLGVELTKIVYSHGGLASPDKTYTIGVSTYGVYNNRNFKVHKRSYNTTDAKNFFNDPSIIYPIDKLNRAIKSTKVRKFKRADMIAGFTKKLRATWDGDYMRIPVGKNDGFNLLLYRATFMKTPYWGMNGLYIKMGRRVSMIGTFTFPEHIYLLDVFDKLQKSVKNVSKQETLIKKITTILKAEHAKKDTWERVDI